MYSKFDSLGKRKQRELWDSVHEVLRKQRREGQFKLPMSTPPPRAQVCQQETGGWEGSLSRGAPAASGLASGAQTAKTVSSAQYEQGWESPQRLGNHNSEGGGNVREQRDVTQKRKQSYWETSCQLLERGRRRERRQKWKCGLQVWGHGVHSSGHVRAVSALTVLKGLKLLQHEMCFWDSRTENEVNIFFSFCLLFSLKRYDSQWHSLQRTLRWNHQLDTAIWLLITQPDFKTRYFLLVTIKICLNTNIYAIPRTDNISVRIKFKFHSLGH